MRRDRILRIFDRDRRVPRNRTNLCRRDCRDRWIKVVGLIVVEVRTTVTRDEGNNLSVGRSNSRMERLRLPIEGIAVLNTSAPYGKDVGSRVKEVRFGDLAKFSYLLSDHPTAIHKVVGGGQRNGHGGLGNAILEVRGHRPTGSEIVLAPGIE